MNSSCWKYFVMSGCLLILFVPVIITFSKAGAGQTGTTPVHPKFPEIAWNLDLPGHSNGRSYADSLDTYFADVSGYRSLFGPVFFGLRNHLYQESPFPEKVVRGRDGWFFLGDYYSNVISETKGLINFSEAEVNQVRENMMAVMAYCRKRNATFYLAIAPDKSSVYGEFLPIEKTSNPTKFDQIRSALSGGEFRFVDLGSKFSANGERILYLKTDSHWNRLGLYYGYLALMNAFRTDFRDIQPVGLDQFIIDTVDTYGGDLAAMISLEIKDRQVRFRPKLKSTAIKEPKRLSIPEGYPLDPATYERRFSVKGKKIKILVFHDSFFGEMPVFMKRHFKESVFLWSGFDYRLVDLEKPDMVIYELAEREIDVLLNSHVP